MPIWRSRGRRLTTSRPSMRIAPWSGVSKPAIMRKVVVLPQPEGPRNDTNSPASTLRLTPRTTWLAPKPFCRPSSSRNAMAYLGLNF
jgi:hypothetical protein